MLTHLPAKLPALTGTVSEGNLGVYGVATSCFYFSSLFGEYSEQKHFFQSQKEKLEAKLEIGQSSADYPTRAPELHPLDAL